MITKVALIGFHRSVQQVGILSDGTLYIDAHVFDDDHGDYADTDYVAHADVVRLKTRFEALGHKAQSDSELLGLLARLYPTAHEAAAGIAALGIPMLHRVDLGARADVAQSMKEVIDTQ